MNFRIAIAVIGVAVSAGALQAQTAQYVGSVACQTCHAEIYERWSKTRMANVVRDPKRASRGDHSGSSKPDPLVTFTKDDIAFVYGSKWKQRYFTEGRRRLFSAAARNGTSTHQIWRPTSCAKAPTGGCRILSRRQHAAPHRPALRRLPLGELQHRRPRR